MTKSAHPLDTPLDQWPQGWLVLECASILRDPLFITMTDEEKYVKHYPISLDEMRDLIKCKTSDSSS